MKRLLLLVLAVLFVLPMAPASAAAGRYAPVDRPGPRLSVPAATLEAAVTCTPSAHRARREVVLFVPPTGIGPESYAWNWFAALDEARYPYCAVTLPNNSVGDLQISAEYIVHAIRHTYRVSGAKIAVFGHSQAGVNSRFALRFWPDARALVADYVAFGAPNHGSTQNDIAYPDGNGPAFNLQMRTYAGLIDALNSGQETFPGISYTSLSTTHDQFVTPITTADLRGPAHRVANIALQDVCPGNTADHIAIGTSDPVAYALAMNAITRPGPADPAAVRDSVCAETFMPGVDPGTYEADLAALNGTVTANIVAAPVLAAEPPLKPYVYA